MPFFYLKLRQGNEELPNDPESRKSFPVLRRLASKL